MLNADLSKQTLQDDQDNMAAVALLDQYCRYPMHRPVSVCLCELILLFCE